MVLLKHLRDRFPSHRNLRLVFLVSSFPVAVWSWIIFLYDLPSFLLSLRGSQILNIFSYLQAIALIESALLFTLVTLLAILLPRGLFLGNYVPQATLLIAALAFWAVGIHLNSEQIASGGDAGSNLALRYLWTAIWVIVFVGLSTLARYWKRWNTIILAFVDRVSLVSGVYLFFPLASLPYVLIRNIVLMIKP